MERKSPVHGRETAVGSPETKREKDRLFLRRVGRRLHVLATGRHRFGWYLEPAYDYSFAGGHQQSIGMSAGLLIGVR
jgi:hypothetical protein